MTVAVCGSRDIDCTMPWATGNTDPSGLITLLVPLPMGPIDTTGYLKVTGPPANPTATVPTYEYWGFPLTQDHEVFGRASFVTPAESKSVANVIAAEFDGGFDPNLGVLVAVVIDCVDAPAPGAQVTLSPADPRTVAISDSNFAPAAPITNSNGVVVFVNVPAGPVTVTANPAAIARPSGTVGVTVRAGMGTTTIVIVPPTPL
jgi:hypothetical protein